jgi:hypothetical protein
MHYLKTGRQLCGKILPGNGFFGPVFRHKTAFSLGKDLCNAGNPQRQHGTLYYSKKFHWLNNEIFPSQNPDAVFLGIVENIHFY